MLKSALKSYFGHDDFRNGQEEIIQSIIDGHNVVVVAPTSYGKSILIQLPALIREGTCLVVSPLIALMQDQVEGLIAKGISATLINSTLEMSEVNNRLNRMKAGEYKLVYIAPERFQSNNFVRALSTCDISLFAVDEFHNINSWGYDFRPYYRKLGEAIELCRFPQVVAVTATATKDVRDDCVSQLGMKNPKTFIKGFDRENLVVNVEFMYSQGEKDRRLLEFIWEQGEDSVGIIYVSTRRTSEDVRDKLQRDGINVLAYHAGMRNVDRTNIQNAFMSGKVNIIVATNAFGMGIDKPNIRFIVHYNMPKSVDAFYQEIGRAGRDGLPSQCLTLFFEPDCNTQRYLISSNNPYPEFIQNCWQNLVWLQNQNLNGANHVITTRYLCRMMGEKEGIVLSVESCINMFERYNNAKRVLNENQDSVIIVLTPEKINPDVDTKEVLARRRQEESRFNEFLRILKSRSCIRKRLVEYFGDFMFHDGCGVCSNCRRKQVKAIGASSRNKLMALNSGSIIEYVEEYAKVYNITEIEEIEDDD